MTNPKKMLAAANPPLFANNVTVNRLERYEALREAVEAYIGMACPHASDCAALEEHPADFPKCDCGARDVDEALAALENDDD